MTDLAQLDAHALIEGYRTKQFKPSEVVEQHLDAIEERNQSLNALLEVQLDRVKLRALDLDRKIDRMSEFALFGVPVAVKDCILVKGWRATAGSKALENYIAPYTATCVERLEAQGAIVLGKANCDEFAMGSSNENSAYGPVCNPWDLERVSGGSSGGSAAAVAGGIASVALGTDTGGSIRQPASLCGIVGLKPSYGRVSRYGVIAYASSLDQVGPMGRTVLDCARVYEVIGGHDKHDPTSSTAPVGSIVQSLEAEDFSLKGVSIGICSAWLDHLDVEVKNAFDGAVELFKSQGAEIIEVELPHTRYALSTFYLIAPAEASSNLARYDGVHYGYRARGCSSIEEVFDKSRAEALGTEVKLRILLGTYALSAGYYDAFYLKAGRVRRLIQQDFERAFESCACILTPTAPTTAFKLGEKTTDPLKMYLSDVFTLPANLAGIPAMSVPCGRDKKGLPIGLQFLGPLFQEQRLLQIAYRYERARGEFSLPDMSELGDKRVTR